MTEDSDIGLQILNSLRSNAKADLSEELKEARLTATKNALELAAAKKLLNEMDVLLEGFPPDGPFEGLPSRLRRCLAQQSVKEIAGKAPSVLSREEYRDGLRSYAGPLLIARSGAALDADQANDLMNQARTVLLAEKDVLDTLAPADAVEDEQGSPKSADPQAAALSLGARQPKTKTRKPRRRLRR